MNRYDISKSQFEKFISGNEYYNIWWRGDNVPDKFKDIFDKIKKEKRDAKNM
jgi:hypothetical protein